MEERTPVARTLEETQATLLVDRAQAAPLQLHPVRRGEGHFLLLSQFQHRKHFLFTFLEDYKKNPALARPWLTMTLHDDLTKDRGWYWCGATSRRSLPRPRPNF